PSSTPIALTFYDGAHGHLKANVEFDKNKFAAYANTVTMSKMLLLQENLPNGEAPIAGLQPKTLSHLMSDLVGQPYDFNRLTLNSLADGGDIMTATRDGATDSFGRPAGALATYPGPITSDLWVSIIDGDHN